MTKLVVLPTSKSVIGSSFWLFISTAVSAGGAYIFWLVLASIGSPEEVGTVAALVAPLAVSVTLVVAALVPTLTVRLASAPTDEQSGLIGSATRSTLILSGVISFAVACLTMLSGVGLLVSLLVALAVISGSLGAIFDASWIALRSSQMVVLRTSTLSGVRLLLGFTFFYVFSFGVVTSIMAWALATLISVIPSSLMLRKRSLNVFNFSSRSRLGRSRVDIGYNYFCTIAAQIPAALLPLMVTFFLGATANAQFYLAWLVASVGFMVPAAATPALLANASNTETPRVALFSAIRFCTAFLIPIILVLAALGPLLLRTLGDDYNSEHMVLLILLLAIPFDTATSLAVSIFRSEKRENYAAWLNIFSTTTIIGLALFLVPLLGPVGAALSFTVGQVLGTLSLPVIYLLRQHKAKRPSITVGQS